MFSRILGIIAIAGCIVTHGKAAVIPADDLTFGPSALTRDTDQQLDFLDVTLSTNRSFNDVSTEFGLGGDYEGFRYATAGELETLFINAGISDLTGNTLSVNFPAVPNLQQLVGVVNLVGPFSGGFFEETSGFIGEADGSGNVFRATLLTDPNAALAGNRAAARVPAGAIPGDNAGGNLGNWLVKASAVPEPSTIASWLLTGLTSLGLVWYGRKRA